MFHTQGRLSNCLAGSWSGPSCIKAPGGPGLQGRVPACSGLHPGAPQGWTRVGGAAGAGRREGQPALPLPSLQGQGDCWAEEAPLLRFRACSSAPSHQKEGHGEPCPRMNYETHILPSPESLSGPAHSPWTLGGVAGQSPGGQLCPPSRVLQAAVLVGTGCWPKAWLSSFCSAAGGPLGFSPGPWVGGPLSTCED